jgi:hypothetical protein
VIPVNTKPLSTAVNVAYCAAAVDVLQHLPEHWRRIITIDRLFIASLPTM